MNCKPGDLAVIVRDSFAENVGRVVTVLHLTGGTFHQPGINWQVHCASPLVVGYYTGFGVVRNGELKCDAACLDDDLRPIRDPGQDATDETLLWLPVPTKQTEPA